MRSLLKLRYWAEYWAVRAALGSLDRLPYGLASWLACRLADLWLLFDWPRRRVAANNILQSGIESDPPRVRALARRSAQHFALVVLESLRSAEILGGERWRANVQLDIADDVLEVLENPNCGIIMASGHFGSWEIAAQLLSRYKPVAGITRAMNNPRVEALIQTRKPRYRFHPIPKYAADPRRFLAVLNKGEILALLTDQHARAGGIPLDFFGRPAATYTTAAMLHLVTRAPLCFAVCRRVSAKKFVLSTSPLIEHQPSGNKKADVRAILTTLNEYLEAEIRRAPEQYLWGHRRWRI